MATKTWLPFADGNSKIVKKGDIIELVTGEKCTFLEIKRTKWIGRYHGKGIRVPVYRDTLETRPFAKAIVGFDESVITVSENPTSFVKGDLFAIEGKKEVYMYDRGDETNIHAVCVASGKKWSIATKGFTLVKIDIAKIKASL